MATTSPEQLTKWATQFKEPLAEVDAQLFEQLQATYVSLLGDAELPRYWPELSPDAIPDAIDYLNLVTSVKNPAPCRYVDDPMANQEVYKGRWRQAFVRRVMQGEVTKLVQVLRKGYAEQLNWDEARIRVTHKYQDQPTGTTSDYERYLEVYWPNLSISHMEAMANSLSERTYVNPIIESEVRSGTWRNLHVSTQKADDGSGVITMFLAISHFRLDSFTNWLTNHNEDVVYLFGYGKDEAQAIINAWKEKGHGATVAFRKDDGLVDIVLRSRDYTEVNLLTQTSSWDCRYKTVVDYHFGVSDPESYPLITTPANGVSYERQLRDNGDGSWDVLIITRTVQYRVIEFQESAVDAAGTTETKRQLGLTTQGEEPVVQSDGISMRQVVEVRDDCSKDVITERRTAKYRVIEFQESSVDARNKAETKRQLGLTNQAQEALVQSAGVSMRQVIDVHDDNSKDVITEKRTAQYRDLPFQTSGIDADVTAETRQQLGLTTESQESMASETGKTKRQRINVYDDDSKDVVTEKNSVTDQTKTSHDNDGLLRRTITDHSANDSELANELPAQGEAIQTENRSTEYPGKTRTRRIIEEAQYHACAEFVSRYGERETEHMTVIDHDDSVPSITDQTASGVETAVLAHNLDRFLTHNYRKMRSVKKFPFDGEKTYTLYGDYELATSQVFSSALGRYWNDKTYVYQRKETHAVRYFKTESEAMSHIGGVFKTDNNGSHYSHTGEFEWRADKITHTKSLVTTYEYDEPTV